MNPYTEFFVVARNNTDPSQPKEHIERYYSTEQRGPEETFAKAESRQRWLKFQEGWQDTRLYEAQKMQLVRDEDNNWKFVSREQVA